MEVAIFYRKVDGKIMRACSLSDNLRKQVTDKDIQKFFPGVDVSHLAMILMSGKQYLDIEKYRVETKGEGEFVDIVEAVDVLSSYNPDAEVEEKLLDRPPSIVVSVLSVIDDVDRLKKYKEAERKTRNRPEVMNFFKERGI